MRALLDSHVLIWCAAQNPRLSPKAHAIVSDPANELLVSVGTIWEIAIKSGLGKLQLSQPFGAWIRKSIADIGLKTLQIEIAHAETQTNLPSIHRDPFDRLLVAQALTENVPIVSADILLDAYGVKRIWS